MPNNRTSILIIYTGGTIGMVEDPATGALEPFKFDFILEEVPELKRFNFKLDTIAFDPPIDSSNITTEVWVKLSEIIQENYAKYTGFVILHGTDTMAYTASALSFIFDNLQKPVILTGSQLPIGTLRTDGRDNLISSIEIAAAQLNRKPIVPEVCIFFQYKLFRGNRTTKINSEQFNAFQSGNYPVLAESGVYIKYNFPAIKYPSGLKETLSIHKNLDTNVAILKIFPGISQNLINSVLHIPGLKALVLETFGSGNAPVHDWFIDYLKIAIQNGLIILNVSQCAKGSVEQNRYTPGNMLGRIGVVGGYDITTEAAITKLMYLLGRFTDHDEIYRLLNESLRGEINIT